MRSLLQSLPKVDDCLRDPDFAYARAWILKPIIQSKIQSLREAILAQETKKLDLLELKASIHQEYRRQTQSGIKPLINGSGVVLQTNLGRSVFHPEILGEVFPLLSAYNNLEYDIAQGKRSERYAHIRPLFHALLGCEDVLVVNNNAAAVLLVLSTFGKGREVIISRGELVEIGGAFRIPEVMQLSGSKLIEVGTTNKTHLSDYQRAITPDTTILMKAHQSNFKQLGFCSSVEFGDLVTLSRERGLIDYYDLGSGYVGGLQIQEEPSLRDLCALSPSLLSFSGDKLFGGPQAGIIVGKTELIAKLKQNQLLRALRVDKFTLLSLEATARAYLNEKLEKIPTLAMLNAPLDALRQRAFGLLKRLEALRGWKIEVGEVDSLAGGGSLPEFCFASYALFLEREGVRASVLEGKLRERGLILRIIKERLCLDVRCLLEGDEERIVQILGEIDA